MSAGRITGDAYYDKVNKHWFYQISIPATLVLAASRPASRLRPVVETMARAVGDETTAVSVASGDHASLGVALRDVGALHALVVRLHSTGGTVGIHAPAWLAAQIARDAAAMLGAATSVTSPVVEKFSRG